MIQEMPQLPATFASVHDQDSPTPFQARLLLHRDIADLKLMRQFLLADPILVEDPLNLPDIQYALDELERAIPNDAPICIVGDCDVDGLAATAIMVRALRCRGVQENRIRSIIFPRTDDGRGLTDKTAELMLAMEPRPCLCLTVDNGSSSQEEITKLEQAGIPVVITDHHHMVAPLHGARAVVNPQRSDSGYPTTTLCGAGVAFQVARLLLGEDRQPLDLLDPVLSDLLVLAMLGTLADIVPLQAENHTIIVHGLRALRTKPGAGLLALLAAMQKRPAELQTQDISFGIAPRLNAAGRMSDPMIALHLLLTDDPIDATEYARQLQELNLERQQVGEEMFVEAREQARQQDAAGRSVLFVRREGWREGLLGLVAGRLVDAFGKPAVVVSIAPGGLLCRGSVRCQGGLHIAEALAAFRPALAEHGGHAQAGGFTASLDQLDDLHIFLEEQCTTTPAAAEQKHEVDAILPLWQLTASLVQEIDQLAPYGHDFKTPLFASTSVTVKRCFDNPYSQTLVVSQQQGDSVVERRFFWRGTKFQWSEWGNRTCHIVYHRLSVSHRSAGEDIPTGQLVALLPADESIRVLVADQLESSHE